MFSSSSSFFTFFIHPRVKKKYVYIYIYMIVTKKIKGQVETHSDRVKVFSNSVSLIRG